MPGACHMWLVDEPKVREMSGNQHPELTCMHGTIAYFVICELPVMKKRLFAVIACGKVRDRDTVLQNSEHRTPLPAQLIPPDS